MSTGVGVMTDRPGAAMAAPQVIKRHNKKAVGVDRFAGANMGIPPAGLAVFFAVIARGVVVTRERVANQYRVAAIKIQCAVGFINQLVGRQHFAAGESERRIEACHVRGDHADVARRSVCKCKRI